MYIFASEVASRGTGTVPTLYRRTFVPYKTRHGQSHSRIQLACRPTNVDTAEDGVQRGRETLAAGRRECFNHATDACTARVLLYSNAAPRLPACDTHSAADHGCCCCCRRRSRHHTPLTTGRQGRRQVKICGVDRHGERGARAYNGDLEAERPPYPSPCKNSSDLYQFQ